MRANELTKSSSIQICIWVSDHLCCKHTVFLSHDTFRHSLCHAFVILLAPLASPSFNITLLKHPPDFFSSSPSILTLLVYLPGLPARQEGGFFLGLVSSRGDVLLQLVHQRFVLWCPGWWRTQESEGFLCPLASYFHSLWKFRILDAST